MALRSPFYLQKTFFFYENKKLTRDITLKIVNLFRIKVRKIRYAQKNYTLKLYTL